LASQISKGNRAWTFVGSVGGSLLIGLAKEAIDENQYNGWDNADLLATVLGGATVGVTIDILKKRKKRKRDEIFRNAIGLENNIPPFDLSVLDNKVPLTVLGMSTRVRSTIP
jgi:putative lipoprotein